MSSLKGRKISILVVPEKEGRALTFKTSVLTLYLGLAIITVAAVIFLVMVFSWSKMSKKAEIYDRLAQENQDLIRERKRVIELQSRVDELQKLESQIRRALGANVAFDSSGQITGADKRNSTEAFAPATLAEHAPEETTGIPPRPAAFQLAEAGILKDVDIPSLWPVAGYSSRGFEEDAVVLSHSHLGVDLVAPEGTAVRATAGGVVVWTGWSALYGNLIVLAHASGYFSLYGHNQVILVDIRQRVERGDPLALLGNTGQSSAPHLHFEIWQGNQPLDPTNLLMPL